MEGVPVLEPLEHSVLEIARNDGPLEEMSHLEPLEHTDLDAALDSRLMEGMTVLEPTEHSVLKETRSDGPTVGILVLEPLGHLVPDVALDWGDSLLIVMAVSDLLVHSGLGETDDVDLDPSMDGTMGHWRDDGCWVSSCNSYLEGRVVLLCTIILYAGIFEVFQRPRKDMT